MKQTALKRSTPSLSRSEFKRTGPAKTRRGISPASKAQRAKAVDECRNCGGRGGSDPAHVVPRGVGGCDHEDCVVSLCRGCHRMYDDSRLDILPRLTKTEQAHAVSHLGALAALHVMTSRRWRPES